MSNDATVEIRSLTKRFGDRTIFEDVSLTVNRGEVVAVIGPSGAGKSTLIRCVNALTPFEKGSLTVLGQEMRGTEENRRGASREVLKHVRTHTGMVFQSFNLFPHLSVLENVVIAPIKVLGLPRDEARARARELLESMGLHSRIEAYPRQLSGGEQQRVAICRALAMKPSLMLFDEPTSMLDPERVGEVLAAIRQLAEQGMTMMLVTHEMRFARDVADTVAVMADGALVEIGPARQVLDSPQADRTKSFLARVLEQAVELPPDEAPSLGALAGESGPGDVQGAVRGSHE
jgi:ABC-type polar amino acid transport system ATPase subunit